MSIHLGILTTDSVLPQFVDTHGDYPRMFRELFGALDSDLRFTNYDVQCRTPPDIICDAYVITGSKCSVYDDLAWIKNLVVYVQEVLAAGKKIIGVCFGHQLMAHYFGGRVDAAPAGWAVGVHDSKVVGEQAWMGHDTADIALLSSHKDQVVELPRAAEVYMSNGFCPLAGFTIGDQVITVQGHPEFKKAYARDLLDLRREVLGEDVYRRGMDSLEQPTTEIVMAKWLLAFVSGGLA